MNPFSRLNGLFFAACCLLAMLSVSKPLSAALTVQTVDGRILSGIVDEQTDDQLLWIRQQTEQIVLTTSVPWSAIVTATDEGASLPLDQLPELLRAEVSSEPIGFLVQKVVYDSPADCQGECLPTQPKRRAVQPRPAKVRSLSVEVFLVNLDRDVEPDGLELFIAALDEHGTPMPVKGSLYVQLWGERIHPHGSLAGHENLERWTQPVVPVDFRDGVASYALRFRTTRPAFDVSLHSTALINVRLGVFGQGNFSASAPVQIRAFNPFRDRLQLTRGSRFLPDELTEEVRHRLPSRRNTRRRAWSR